MDKLALGIYFDGLYVHAALVKKEHGLISIESLESFRLYDSLEQTEEIENSDLPQNGEQPTNPEDPFGFDLDGSAQSGDVTEARGNIDVIVEMLAKMAPEGCPIAFNLHNSNVIYTVVDVDKKVSKSQLKKLIAEELAKANEQESVSGQIGFAPIADLSYLGVVHKDPLIFANLLSEAVRLMHRQSQPIKLIDTIEFSLAELVHETYQLSDVDRTAVVLFSQNFTKIFFMKGSKIDYILPTIHIGIRSSKICETAFSKLLYELDFKGLELPRQIVLTGEVDAIDAEDFFQTKFPNINIVKFEVSESYLAPHLQGLAGKTSPYSVAIALATKVLRPKKERIYKNNFVPKKVREQQSQFVIAWHGFAMIGLVFLTLILLFLKSSAINSDIAKVKNSLEEINFDLSQLKNVEHDVDSLRLEISHLEKGTSLIDSLSAVTTRWTPLIKTFSDAYEKIGKFTIKKFESVSDEKMVVSLNLSRLEQVALLERFISDSKVLSVGRQKTEDQGEILEMTIECDLSHQKLKKPEAAKINN
ncbi:hypothetical protein B6D60_01130 [candidate division KSB1 bacterium 4484_87]|nr:MAG: hypothetical protein B6D60_01130 [candidate division KSB1 bacterium 4484_87]